MTNLSKIKTAVFIPATLITVLTFSACDSSNNSNKVQSAQENIDDAEEDLRDAKDDYREELAKFKKESVERINANEKKVNEFKSRTKNSNREIQKEHEKHYDDLDKRNKTMRTRLNEFEYDSKENWDKFKTDFNREMDSIGSDFEDFTNRNTNNNQHGNQNNINYENNTHTK